jgi:pimeloyl-ACP methyl ester carboxylesterase
MPPEGNRALAEFTRNPTRENFDRAYRLFVWDPSILLESFLDQLWADYQEWAAISTPRPAAARDDLLPALSLIQAETLIVRGKDDRLAPLDQGLLGLALIKNAQLHIYAACGHWVQYEKTDELHKLLLSFLT